MCSIPIYNPDGNYHRAVDGEKMSYINVAGTTTCAGSLALHTVCTPEVTISPRFEPRPEEHPACKLDALSLGITLVYCSANILKQHQV